MADPVLQMNSSKHCFDEVASGRRKVEIRPLTPFWRSRLDSRKYSEIHMRNGYSATAPFLRVEFKGVEIRDVEGQPCYAIKLGQILEVQNYG
jgi:hypothetical protein